jgi:hypothetical protein
MNFLFVNKSKGSQPKEHNTRALRLSVIFLLIHKISLTNATLLYCIRQKWKFSRRLHLEMLKCEFCTSNNNYNNRANVDMVNGLICCCERCRRTVMKISNITFIWELYRFVLYIWWVSFQYRIYVRKSLLVISFALRSETHGKQHFNNNWHKLNSSQCMRISFCIRVNLCNPSQFELVNWNYELRRFDMFCC